MGEAKRNPPFHGRCIPRPTVGFISLHLINGGFHFIAPTLHEEKMSRFRRNYVKGGSYFFTVVTYGRQKLLNGEGVDILRQSFHEVIEQKPFRIDAIVVLPDHLHCIWQLPPEDDDYSTRWKKIKTYFTKEYKRRQSRKARFGKGAKGLGIFEFSPLGA